MLTYMTNASKRIKHKIKSENVAVLVTVGGQGAGRTIIRAMVVEKVAWPTTNLHIHIKSKVSLHAN